MWEQQRLFIWADEQGGFGPHLVGKCSGEEPGIRWQEIEGFRAGFFLGSNDGAGGRRRATSSQPQLDKGILLPASHRESPEWLSSGKKMAWLHGCAWGDGWRALKGHTGAL